MNSRDAAYEQEMQALIEQTAAEAAAAEATRSPVGREPLVTSPAALNGLDTKPADTIPEPEPDIVSARRKRKRTEDERCAAVGRVVFRSALTICTRLQQLDETRAVCVDSIRPDTRHEPAP